MPEALELTVVALISAAGIFAQSPAPRPAFGEFEVAAIKPVTDDSPD